jgi:hypothetical protein
MLFSRTFRKTFLHCALAIFALTTVAACGDDSTDPDDGTTVLDQTKSFVAGESCDNNGGINFDFTSSPGKTVVITASGAVALRPAFVLYAPDFGEQLGFSTAGSPGKASLTKALTHTGAHHVTVCEQNGLGAVVRLTVVEQ